MKKDETKWCAFCGHEDPPYGASCRNCHADRSHMETDRQFQRRAATEIINLLREILARLS